MPKSTHNLNLTDEYGWGEFVTDYQLIEDPKALSPSFFCRANSPVVDKRMIEILMAHSAKENCDVRICLHRNPETLFQNMIIVHQKKNYYRPHAHVDNGETYQILVGELGIPFFDFNGNISDMRRMKTEHEVIVRIPIDVTHAMFPLSDVVVFHESKSGPFIPGKDTFHPNWAPDAADAKAVQKYKDSVQKAFDTISLEFPMRVP